MKGYIESIDPLQVDYGSGMRIVVSFNSQDCKIELTVNELVDRIRKFRPYIELDGGVTFIGDILIQMDFIVEAFKLCHKSGIKTCVQLTKEDIVRANQLLKHIDAVILIGEMPDEFMKLLMDHQIRIINR